MGENENLIFVDLETVRYAETSIDYPVSSLVDTRPQINWSLD